jgi:hypothetical protein
MDGIAESAIGPIAAAAPLYERRAPSVALSGRPATSPITSAGFTDRRPTMSEFEQLPDDARMNAYYYGFERTGIGPIDAILSAVAVAGKGSHHTSDWCEKSSYDYYKGRPGLPDADSALDLIQSTANRSAAQVRAALAAQPTVAEVKAEALRGLS